PKKQLVGFEKKSLKPGENTKVTFSLTEKELSIVDKNGKRKALVRHSLGGGGKDVVKVWVGGIQPGYEKMSDCTELLKGTI
ncbi:MAG: fibronectin type III-like domain-contianing protein, partial [Bacteroidales bacterium]|nr:fibronectin type III-like domain-contianing protein [Bacteroidales bacterium]